MKALDRYLKRLMEEVILRLHRTGAITVTVENRTVVEAPKRRPCKPCSGSGRLPRPDLFGRNIDLKIEGKDTETVLRRMQMERQGICLACEGRGDVPV